MERHQILDMLRELKLYGMRAAFDEVVAAGLKRQLSVTHIIGDPHHRRPVQAEIAEKQARSVSCPITIARLLLAKELSDFDFAGTPINEGLVRDHRDRRQDLALQKPRLSRTTPACPGGQTGTSRAAAPSDSCGHSAPRGALLFATGQA